MKDADDTKRAAELAQQGVRGAELVTKIIQFAAASEPTLPLVIVGNAALAAAIGLWREGGLPDAQVATVLRDLATSYESGALASPDEG